MERKTQFNDYEFSKKIYVEICNKCNFKCKHCYNASSQKKNDFMSISMIRKIIEECKKNRILHITLSGGEPLLHPQIKEILSEILGEKLTVGIITNGILLNREILDIYRDNMKRMTLQISLHGSTPDIHSKLTDTSVSDKIFEIIPIVNREKIEYKINCVINKHNMYDVERIIEYSKSNGAKGVSFGFIQPFGRATNSGNFNIEIHELINYYNGYLKDIKLKYNDYITLPEYKNTRCPAVTYHISGKKNYYSPRIDCTGNVFLCSMFVSPKYALGNIEKSGLNEIFESERLDDLLTYLHLRSRYVDKCNDCIVNAVCARGCPALSAENDIICQSEQCNIVKSEIILNSLAE